MLYFRITQRKDVFEKGTLLSGQGCYKVQGPGEALEPGCHLSLQLDLLVHLLFDRLQLHCKPVKVRNDDFISNYHFINSHHPAVWEKKVTRCEKEPVSGRNTEGWVVRGLHREVGVCLLQR